jgi:hypothetical protein
VGLFFDKSEVQILKEYLEIWRPLLFQRRLYKTRTSAQRASNKDKDADVDDDKTDGKTEVQEPEEELVINIFPFTPLHTLTHLNYLFSSYFSCC